MIEGGAHCRRNMVAGRVGKTGVRDSHDDVA